MVALVTLAKLASALVQGDDNVIERLVANKLESIGEKVLFDLIGKELGIAGRVSKAVRTGGVSELNRLRDQWLNGLTPARLPGSGVIGRLEKSFLKNRHLLSRPEGRYQTWSKSRQEWLNEGWKHDWRSQPRDPYGRWVPGRLKHPYVSKGARRIRRARKLAARKAVRESFNRD